MRKFDKMMQQMFIETYTGAELHDFYTFDFVKCLKHLEQCAKYYQSNGDALKYACVFTLQHNTNVREAFINCISYDDTDALVTGRAGYQEYKEWANHTYAVLTCTNSVDKVLEQLLETVTKLTKRDSYDDAYFKKKLYKSYVEIINKFENFRARDFGGKTTYTCYKRINENLPILEVLIEFPSKLDVAKELSQDEEDDISNW